MLFPMELLLVQKMVIGMGRNWEFLLEQLLGKLLVRWKVLMSVLLMVIAMVEEMDYSLGLE
jgi:hypothetical protein